MPRAKLVLWRDHAELLDVRSGFYPSLGGQDRRRDAINIVRAWSVRGKVPHLIDSTSILTEAVLNDASGVSQQVVRLAYSAAFCRFVSGLTDGALQGAFHRTMYKVARHLGLSTALVELRHAATHQRLLSLTVLRKAAQRSLEWLWDNYWVKIDKDENREKGADMDRSSEVEESKDMFRRILKSYKQSRVMRAKQKMPFDEDETRKVSRRIQDICSESAEKISMLIHVLLEPRFIIPDGRRFEDTAWLDIGFSLWNDILKTLSNLMTTTFLPALLDGLLDDLGKQPKKSTLRNNMHKDNIYLWISHILSSHEWEETLNIVNIDLESVLQKCFVNPNDWTLKVASRLFSADKTLEDNYAELALLTRIQLEADFEPPEFLTWRWRQYGKEKMEEAESQLISEVREEVEGFEANRLRLKMLLDQMPTYEYAAEEDLDVLSLMSEGFSANGDEQEMPVAPSNFSYMNGTAKGWRRYEGQWIPKPIGVV